MIRQTCNSFEIEILKGVVSKDHVHLLVSAPPECDTKWNNEKGKGGSSPKLFESFPDLNKRNLGRHFWSRGYFVSHLEM